MGRPRWELKSFVKATTMGCPPVIGGGIIQADHPVLFAGQETTMFNDLGCINVLEAADLPEKTIRAPLHMVREIRLTLGPLPIRLEVGGGEDVYISSDLFSAFAKWSDQLDVSCEDPTSWN